MVPPRSAHREGREPQRACVRCEGGRSGRAGSGGPGFPVGPGAFGSGFSAAGQRVSAAGPGARPWRNCGGS